VVRVWLAHVEQLSRREWKADAPARAELDHTRIAADVGVVDVEAVVALVVGREREREQPLLSPARDPPAQVDERPAQAAPDEVDDPAGLFDGVEPVRLRRRRGDRRQRAQTLRDEADGQLLRMREDGGREQCREHQLKLPPAILSLLTS
jgi:hypothetical protein